MLRLDLSLLGFHRSDIRRKREMATERGEGEGKERGRQDSVSRRGRATEKEEESMRVMGEKML